jgi:hypothetical protein
MNNKRFKSNSTKYYLLFTMKRIIRYLNNENNLDYEAYKKIPAINRKTLITKKEENSIINVLKEKKDKQNLLIFYFLYIKGLNYSTVARILLSSFKNAFSQLIIKKGKSSKYKIEPEISKILLEFMREQEYVSTYFFYNDILDTKTLSRAKYIKDNFISILDECFWIENKRKNEIVNYFSVIRTPKIPVDINIFKNDLLFTYGYFDESLSPFRTEKNNKYHRFYNEFELEDKNENSSEGSSFVASSECKNLSREKDKSQISLKINYKNKFNLNLEREKFNSLMNIKINEKEKPNNFGLISISSYESNI